MWMWTPWIGRDQTGVHTHTFTHWPSALYLLFYTFLYSRILLQPFNNMNAIFDAFVHRAHQDFFVNENYFNFSCFILIDRHAGLFFHFNAALVFAFHSNLPPNAIEVPLVWLFLFHFFYKKKFIFNFFLASSNKQLKNFARLSCNLVEWPSTRANKHEEQK